MQAFIKMFRYILLISMLFTAKETFAESQSASFNAEEKSLLSVMAFPNIKGNVTVMINCSGLIRKNRKMKFFLCYKNQPGDEIYIQEIYKANKKAKYNPAILNNKKVDVFVQFRILFIKNNDETTIQLALNPGYQENIIAYGGNYVSAQRVVGSEDWQKHCPKYNRYRLLSKAHVNRNGVASNANITSLNGITINNKCKNTIISTLNNSQYLPAKSNEVNVPSTYIELFGN